MKLPSFNLDDMDWSKLYWHGDHSSLDMGYEEDFNVGQYSYGQLFMYMNTETLEVLELWFED